MQHIRVKKQLKFALGQEKTFCGSWKRKKTLKWENISTHFFIDWREALFAELVYHLRHANHIARSIFDRHAEESFGPVAGLYVNFTIKAFILWEKTEMFTNHHHHKALRCNKTEDVD